MNTARGAICNAEDIAAALKSGQLAGYAGDVWNVQPAPREHAWRYMKNPLGGGNGMTPHYSGTTLDAQARYAAGTKKIIENYLAGKPQNPSDVIIGVGACSLSGCVVERCAVGADIRVGVQQASTRPSRTASGRHLVFRGMIPRMSCVRRRAVSFTQCTCSIKTSTLVVINLVHWQAGK